ncbi:MAG: transcription elongation factor GreA [Patescibacteria group bacterium]|nr:transcription elongation factor GreA [Patescibacteria group bacterium]
MADAKVQDDDYIYVTKQGLKELEEELEYLQKTKRKEVASRLKEAISYGDLSENSEYEEAKNEQAFVEGRIFELEDQIKRSKIISDSQKSGKTISLGSKVVVKLIKAGSEGETEEYTIVGSTEADPMASKISNQSPVGAALMGHGAKAVIDVKVPAGKVQYKILKVS